MRRRRAISEKGDGHELLPAATIARRAHFAKCFFCRARRQERVPENPFEHLRAVPQRKAIIAPSRFVGLRCPCGIVELR